MRRVACAAFALLAACTTPQRAGDQVMVVWTRVDDPQAACQKLSGQPQVFAIRGCSRWN